MQIVELSKQEYENFLRESAIGYNFMQSSEYLQTEMGSDDTCVLAGVDDGRILYTVIVIFRPALRFFKYAASMREWVAARPSLLQDKAKLDDFISAMAHELIKRKAICWFVESSVEYQQHDKNGAVVEDGFHNEDYRTLLEEVGFTALPLWKGYDEARQSRWVSWIDLQKNLPETYRGFPAPLKSGLEEYTWKELLSEMAGNTRRSFAKTDLPYIECDLVRGDQDFSLDTFEQLLESSSEKHSFNTGSKEHRRRLLADFGDKGYLCTSYLNTAAYQDYLDSTLAALGEKEAAAREVCEKMPNSKKKRNQLLEIQEAIAHAQKEEKELAVLKEKEPLERIPLASGIFLETPSEMVYLFGGSRPDLARYMGAYANQKTMIHLALDHGLQRYNFWGISGNFQPDEDGYGVFFFKKNLGATVGEYCGEFVKVLNPLTGRLFLEKVRTIHK